MKPVREKKEKFYTNQITSDKISNLADKLSVYHSQVNKNDYNFYNIKPVPKPTGPRKGGNKGSWDRYKAFRDEVVIRQVKLPTSGAHVFFIIPFPKSYSKKKRAELLLKPHEIKPDLKNLIAALEDSVYPRGSVIDDSRIWNYAGLTKLWGEHGGILIHRR